MTTGEPYFTTDPGQPQDPCATCGRPHGGNYQPRHPFRAKGSAVVLEPPKTDPHAPVTIRGSRFPFDPVLRQALIDKGVLTPGDLRDAEDKINAITGQIADALTTGGKPYVHTREVSDDDGATTPIGWSGIRPGTTEA